MSTRWALCLLLGALLAAPAAAFDARAVADRDVVVVVTRDADGARRDTRVWIVALDGRAYVRTGDSRWLANIRRGSPVALRVGDGPEEEAVRAREVDDPGLEARVEAAFIAKYGFLQRVMSLLRLSEPTVLELTPP